MHKPQTHRFTSMDSFRDWVTQCLTDKARALESNLLEADARLADGLDLDDITTLMNEVRRDIPGHVDHAVAKLRAVTSQ